jgi:3-oxoadipate enol-lactonase
MRWVEANGVALRYELGGHGAESVVLVHELGGALESWDETLPAFQRHFRTLRYDQRGCGLSEKIRGRITIEDVVSDIDGLLDALSISAPCHFVGCALGAGIALAFAARHPERVARLAISSPVTGSDPAIRTSMEQRAAAVEREGMRSIVTRALDASYPEVMRANRARYETFRARWLANDPCCYGAMSRMGAEMDLGQQLAGICCPTLVIAPTYDKNRTPSKVHAIACQIPGARYVEAESAHFMPVQSPELFAQHVVPFLREL